jgi:hypothetical protein
MKEKAVTGIKRRARERGQKRKQKMKHKKRKETIKII